MSLALHHAVAPHLQVIAECLSMLMIISKSQLAYRHMAGLGKIVQSADPSAGLTSCPYQRSVKTDPRWGLLSRIALLLAGKALFHHPPTHPMSEQNFLSLTMHPLLCCNAPCLAYPLS